MGSTTYVQRLRQLNRSARLYLLHAALLTASLAISRLFFNLTILALGYPRTFIGVLDTVAIAVAAVLSVPLWWLVTRIGLRTALIISAILQATSVLLVALWPVAGPLVVGVALTGVAAVLYQVSVPPFMMQHSDDTTRDYLFSANWAINVGIAGLGSLIAGTLPTRFGLLLSVGSEDALAYRATFAVAGLGLVLSLAPLLLIKSHGYRVSPTVEAGASDAERAPVKEQARPRTDAALPAWVQQRAWLRPLIMRLPDTVRRLLDHPWSWIQLLFSPLFISFGAALLVRYFDLFFKERFGISNETLGLIFASAGIATGLASLAGPVLSTRIGKIRAVALAQVVSIPFLLMVGFVPVLGVAVAAELTRRSLFNMGSPLYDAFAMERTDEPLRPLVIGIINGAYTVGYLVAPMISTRVQVRYGFGPLFVATTICYGLAVLANYWLFIHRRQRDRAGVVVPQ